MSSSYGATDKGPSRCGMILREHPDRPGANHAEDVYRDPRFEGAPG